MSLFKPGDWVIDITAEEGNFIKLTEDHLYFKQNVNAEEWQKNFEFVNKYKLWKPEQGEWCWIFGQTPYNVPTIGKFKHSGKDILYFESTNGQLYISTECEPFIGKLPSFLKAAK